MEFASETVLEKEQLWRLVNVLCEKVALRDGIIYASVNIYNDHISVGIYPNTE